jgi:hypothetical protein
MPLEATSQSQFLIFISHTITKALMCQVAATLASRCLVIIMCSYLISSFYEALKQQHGGSEKTIFILRNFITRKIISIITHYM